MRKAWEVAEVTQVEYDGHHDAGPNVFVQWKGTDVCFDFWCECGKDCHFDGYFASCFECPYCGEIWLMPSTIYPMKRSAADPSTYLHRPVVPERDEEPVTTN